MSANARIDADTKRTVAEIKKAWSDMYGQFAPLDQRRVQGEAALQGEITRVESAGAEEKKRNRQQLEDETDKLAAAGTRSGLDPRRGSAAGHPLTATPSATANWRSCGRGTRRMRICIAGRKSPPKREKNGKLMAQQRELRDKLAGTFRSLMDNPLQALRHLGEDAASKYAADFVLKHTGRGGSQAGGAGSPGITGGRGIGTILDLPFPGFSGRGYKPGSRPGAEAVAPPDRPEAPHVATSATVSAASTVLNASMAEIHIGQATFANMPGGSAGAVPAVAAMRAAGSPSSATAAYSAAQAGFGEAAFYVGSAADLDSFSLPDGYRLENCLAWASPQGYIDAEGQMHIIQDCDAYTDRILRMVYTDTGEKAVAW